MAGIFLFKRKFFVLWILTVSCVLMPETVASAAAPLEHSSSAAAILDRVFPVVALPELLSPAATVPASAVPAIAFLAIAVLLLAVAAGYLAFRYFSLKGALRKLDWDLQEICRELSDNRILRLPLPDRDLEKLTESVNASLADIRQERLSYEIREREFQQLIENISHDLRTPLTVILGYLKWMRRGEADAHPLPSGSVWERSPGDGSHPLDIIERNARSMEKLVSQFYAFSRLQARDYVLEMEEMDVCRILRESLAGQYEILEEAHLELCVKLPEHPVMVRGNGEALERIFSNLLQNAGRYALSRLEIYMEERVGQGILIVFQNDTGNLTESDIPHLFERFYKQDDSRQQGGSGLGLTVAKSLTEQMGGSLTADLVTAADGEGDSGTLIRLSISLPAMVS